jgi:hypothetical protein
VRRSGHAASSAPGVLRQEFSLQPPPQEPAEDPAGPASFWQQVYDVPEEDWWDGVHGNKGARVYLYNDQPGAPYIAVVREPFDIDWVRETYGGGRYKALLNDASGKIKAQIKFSIEGESRKKPPQSVGVAQPAAQDPLTALVEMFREEQRETRALVREFMSRERNGNGGNAAEIQMQLLPTIVGGVVKMFTEGMPRPGDPLEMALKLQALMKPPDMLSVLKDAKAAGLIPDVTSGGSMLEQLSGIMAVAEKLGFTQSAAAGGKSWAEMLIDKGPDILKVFSDGIKNYRELEEKRLETAKFIAAQQPHRQPVITPPPAGQPAPAARPAPGPQPAAAAPQPSAAPLQVEPIGSAAPAQAVAELSEAQINQIKASIVQAIGSGASGVDIFGFLRLQFPAFLNGMCIFDNHQQVTGVVTVDQLAQFCAMDPVLSQAAQYPNFRDVLHDLLAEVKFATMGIEDDQPGPDQKVG